MHSTWFMASTVSSMQNLGTKYTWNKLSTSSHSLASCGRSTAGKRSTVTGLCRGTLVVHGGRGPTVNWQVASSCVCDTGDAWGWDGWGGCGMVWQTALLRRCVQTLKQLPTLGTWFFLLLLLLLLQGLLWQQLFIVPALSPGTVFEVVSQPHKPFLTERTKVWGGWQIHVEVTKGKSYSNKQSGKGNFHWLSPGVTWGIHHRCS